MKNMRFFEAMGERDFLRFCLEQMYEQVKNRSPLDKAIDEATRHEEALTKEAKKIMARIDKLNKIIDALTG